MTLDNHTTQHAAAQAATGPGASLMTAPEPHLSPEVYKLGSAAPESLVSANFVYPQRNIPELT